MTAVVANYFRRMRSRQIVRPWALAAPVVVLAIALPLLRPLRSPALASQTELSYLASIQSFARLIPGVPVRRGPSESLSTCASLYACELAPMPSVQI